MRLTAAILTHNAVHCLPNAIQSLLSHVDKITVSVDDRTADGTLAWLSFLTVICPAVEFYTYKFTMERGFAGAYNDAVDRAGGDWTFVLDSDEVVDQPHAMQLREICERGDREGIDCFGFPRRNWWDTKRESFRAEWWPDHQWRLMKKNVRFWGRVHPGMRGHKRMLAVEPGEATLQHFNLAYRTEADWQVTNEFYKTLMDMDIAEGRKP